MKDGRQRRESSGSTKNDIVGDHVRGACPKTYFAARVQTLDFARMRRAFFPAQKKDVFEQQLTADQSFSN
jgi:hypothetical protein